MQRIEFLSKFRSINTPEGTWYLFEDFVRHFNIPDYKLAMFVRSGNRIAVTIEGIRHIVVDEVGAAEIFVRYPSPETTTLVKQLLTGAGKVLNSMVTEQFEPISRLYVENVHKELSTTYEDDILRAVSEKELCSQRQIQKLVPNVSIATVNRILAKHKIAKDEYGFYSLPKEVQVRKPVKTVAEPAKVENTRYFKYVPNSTIAGTIRDIRSGKNSHKLQEIYQFMREEDVEKANELYDAGLLV